MHYSQVGQDLFALQTAKNKSYIEIGAADPLKLSNTFLLLAIIAGIELYKDCLFGFNLSKAPALTKPSN